MAQVIVRRGREGPSHDPYSFTEIKFCFTNPRRKPVILHEGLGSWVQWGRRRFIECKGRRPPHEIFEELTGLSARRAEAIPDVLLGRYLRRLTKEERWSVWQCMEADAAMLRNAY